MITKNLLQYYLECLKYESYYSTQLKPSDLNQAQIDPLNIEFVVERYEKLSHDLKDDQTIMFGYPLLRVNKKGGFIYLPLILWSNSTFLSDHNLYKADQCGFHQEVYKSLADKQSLNILTNLKEQFSSNPTCFLDDNTMITQLLEIADLEETRIVTAYTVFQAKNSNFSNYHISQEIQGILNDKFEPSPVLKSYLNHSYAVPNMSDDQMLIHIVPGNLPQNTVLHDINHTINIVKGPPGTGKTQTILNLIANQVNHQETCVIASTNNQAVDNIVEKLDANGISKYFFGYVRLGNIAKNKEAAVPLQSALDRMIEIVNNNQYNVLSAETYSDYKNKSQALMDEITRAEQIENQIIDMTSTINQLQDLINVLNDRLRLNHLIPMKNDLKSISIANEKIEFRLRELLDKPLQLYGNDIFRRFRSYIAGRIHTYLKFRMKKQLRSIGAIQLWEHIDSSTPVQSLAFCEEIIKVINLELRCSQLVEELASIKKQQQDASVDLKNLYKKKNEIDLHLLQYQWLHSASPVLKDMKELQKIKGLIQELREKGNIRNSSSAFPSFLKLFPVLLVSSLSARNCIPAGMSLDLAIIDESSQCSIPSIFCLLQSARKACLFGDTNQLSHIVSIEDTFSRNLFETHAPGIDPEPYCYLNNSAFERAEQACQLSEGGTHLLNYHYRCIPSIASFSNQQFYHNRLRMMRHEPERQPYTAGIYSTNVYGSVSGTINHHELNEIHTIVNKLEQNGIDQIGIVTPFSAQKEHLIKMFSGKPNIKIGTVHTFQGGECKAIIFSTVISQGSTSFQINFVQNSYRLINVALTRALDYFMLVGNLAQIDNGQGYLTKLSRYIYTIEASNFHRPSIELSIAFNQIIRQENRIKLMHEGERMIYNKLLIFLGGMPLLVFPKVPIKDVLSINLPLDYSLKNFYFSSHMDFVIYERESLQPLCSIEYDGSYHRRDPKTILNDKMKDDLCSYTEFKLIRIKSNDETGGWEELKGYLQSIG
ncbi:AAA domain-containing protein [Paenibacillus sp. FSL H3-0302]|uniref:AAA domain-containing protein n=1 Tax=Paenibacillus sp. FSL H3-0302 TaxID=2921428 RepID=UPI0030EB8C2F